MFLALVNYRKKLQMETMETASMKALATAPNAAACLLDQRVPRGPLEVCLACAGLIESLSTSDAFIIDSLLFKLMCEPGAERRGISVEICARFADKTPEAARLRPVALRRSSMVMRQRPAHSETKGAAMPANQASAEKVKLRASIGRRIAEFKFKSIQT